MDDAGANADAPAAAAGSPTDARSARRDATPTASLLQMAEHSNDLVAITDPAGRLTYLNAAGRRLTGAPATGRPEGTLADLLDPAQRALLVDTLLPAARAGGVAEGEVRLIDRATGACADAALSLFALRDPQGVPTGLVVLGRDLTEEKRERERLARARAAEIANGRQLDALYSKAPLGLGLIDREFRFVRINPALAAMNGLPAEAHIGRVVWDLVPDLRASAEPMLRRVLETGQPLRDVIVRGSTPAEPGREREWAEQFYPFRDSSGQIAGVGIIAEDVTDKFRAVRELAAREDELRRVLDRLFAFVGILTPDGRVTYANSAPLDAAGMGLSAVEGRDFADTPWWNYDPAVQARLRAAMAAARAGETVRYDVPVMLGQALVTIDFQIAPLHDRDGNIAALVPSGAIIEQRVQAETALRTLTQNLEAEVERRTAALEAANRQLTREIRRREAAQAALAQSQKLEALGQLTSGIAHDFNNLLAAVTGGLTLIERRIDDPAIRAIAGHSKAAAFRGAKLIKQMLAFARQEVLEPRAVDLPELLGEVEPLMSQAVPGCTIASTVPAGLPAVLVDPTLLEAALLNLAVNAADAMPAGGTLTIVARAVGAEDESRPAILGERMAVALSVGDTGCGIAPDILERVLEPFYTTKTGGKGTGLGLAMVHGFVTQSGGDMTIRSTVGAGTEVTLFLPCAGSGGADGSAGEDDNDTLCLGEGALLLVDDDDDVRAITAAQLRALGYRVTEADGMASALAALDGGLAPELVLSDVVMPGGDGIALAAALEARIPGLPVVFMTERAETARLDGRTVLYKPFDLPRLSRAVAAALKDQSAR